MLVDTLPPCYNILHLNFHSVGSYFDFRCSTLNLFNERLAWTPPGELFEMLDRLRVGMYRPGIGTWFSAKVRFTYPTRLDIGFDWTREPRWEGIPPAVDAYQEELQRFPRDSDATPGWPEQRARLRH
ncbi:hypothetical protein [Nocardia yamanashiensis]|uniref:hypothetical protein n=1 Tax=Nocardia yamanashiensis TaxID=209247 RepID=UPI00082EF52B|nr:hypothetical protein [Nocardia yamanashiensis]